ncbi:FAD-dependent oxidoreductase [Pseudosulfitobacter sp. SM2401]|uniref:NAD(P)/FAD-dependent oxidoreductase n=1 Tax=Pseudosulfitobacter sp. SM2401 TaxID=3350098 RepID=UPI0036F252CF
MTTADITVRGAGIFGLSIAWACVRRGARVQIIDPNGAASGSSGGIVGALAPHVPEKWDVKKQFQLDSLLMARAFWSEIEDTSGTASGYARTGRLQPILNARGLELAKTRGQNATELWGAHATWSVLPSSDAPWGPTSPTGYLVHDTLSARIHPRMACAALVAALATKGIRVKTDGVDQGQTLWATGVPGLEKMSKTYSRLIGAGEKGQAALLQFDAPDAPQIYVDNVHIIPHANGTVGIGSTTERYFDAPFETDDQLDALIERTRAALPVLADAPVLERWAGLRPRSHNRAPMLGAWPDQKRHFIANGGFKIGFGIAPKVAEVMADLMLENRDAIPEAFGVTL